MQPDPAAAAKEIAWFRGKPEEYQSLGDQSQNALIHGEFKKAAALAQQGARLADQHDLEAAAEQLLAQVAGMGEFRGSCDGVQQIGGVAALLCSEVRQPPDIDLAIDRSDLDATRAALEAAGFKIAASQAFRLLDSAAPRRASAVHLRASCNEKRSGPTTWSRVPSLRNRSARTRGCLSPPLWTWCT